MSTPLNSDFKLDQDWSETRRHNSRIPLEITRTIGTIGTTIVDYFSDQSVISQTAGLLIVDTFIGNWNRRYFPVYGGLVQAAFMGLGSEYFFQRAYWNNVDPVSVTLAAGTAVASVYFNSFSFAPKLIINIGLGALETYVACKRRDTKFDPNVLAINIAQQAIIGGLFTTIPFFKKRLFQDDLPPLPKLVRKLDLPPINSLKQ